MLAYYWLGQKWQSYNINFTDMQSTKEMASHRCIPTSEATLKSVQ